MKIKIIKRENDFIVDYARENNMHILRQKVLEFLIQTSEDPVFLYIDTNSRTEQLPIEGIEKILAECEITFRREPVEKMQRGAFGFVGFFKSEKKKTLSENMILAEVGKNTTLDVLYDKLLRFYDYAIVIGSSRDMSELILRLKMDVADVLFNKEIFTNTFYDSIVLKRMRMDAPYASLEAFIVNMKNLDLLSKIT